MQAIESSQETARQQGSLSAPVVNPLGSIKIQKFQSCETNDQRGAISLPVHNHKARNRIWGSGAVARPAVRTRSCSNANRPSAGCHRLETSDILTGFNWFAACQPVATAGSISSLPGQQPVYDRKILPRQRQVWPRLPPEHAEHARQLDLAQAGLVRHHPLDGPEVLQTGAVFGQPFRRLEMHQRADAET